MEPSPRCPRCSGETLVPLPEDPTTLTCPGCQGILLPPANVPADFQPASEPAGETAAESASTAGNAPVDIPVCPGCQGRMSPVAIDESAFLCGGCGSAWIDSQAKSPAAGSEVSPEGDAARLSRYLMYSLTLPERLARSAVGLTAGLARETAEFLVPQAFKNSKTYEVVIRNSLKFLTEDVGGVAPKPDELVLGKDFAARKAVGNFVDLAGWATLAVSPVWLMAVVSDIAYGSKTYIHELAGELRQKGLIAEDSTIHNIDDLLAAVKDASGTTASLIDTPPLSVEQLRESLSGTRQALSAVEIRKILPEAELKRYWQEMRSIAARENVSLIGVSGALTMHLLKRAGTLTKGTLTGAVVVGKLVNRHVFGHYAAAMKDVREKGFYNTVRETSGPYIQSLWNNFAVDRSTWTAELLSGRAIGRALAGVRGWFLRTGGGERPAAPSTERPQTSG